MPDKVVSIAKDFSVFSNFSSLDKTILPALIFTLSIFSGQISFATSSAFKKSKFSEGNNSYNLTDKFERVNVGTIKVLFRFKPLPSI